MAGEVTIYQQGGILADGELPFDGSSLEVLEGEDLALHGWTTLPPPASMYNKVLGNVFE